VATQPQVEGPEHRITEHDQRFETPTASPLRLNRTELALLRRFFLLLDAWDRKQNSRDEK
jgi:hypothetical protein